MRSLKDNQLLTPIEVSAAHPDGAIIDETVSVNGTAVVREIYNDPLVNIYKLLRLVGMETNGLEDGEDNGYQLIQALQKLPNIFNDIEQPLSLNATVFSLNIDITYLPNKYLIVAKAADDYVATTAYTFKGSQVAPAYGFSSPTGFKAGDEILIVLDQTGIKAYSLTGSLTPALADVFAPFGTPVAFNNSGKVWYQSEGVLFSDFPESYDIQSAVRIFEADGTVIVYEMVVIATSLLCLTFRPGTLIYRIYKFDMTNLTADPVVMAMAGQSFPTGVVTDDFKPFMFTEGVEIFITNHSGNNANDYALDIYLIDLPGNQLLYSATNNMDNRFVKTTNCVLANNAAYTFMAGVLEGYNLSTGFYKLLGSFPGYVGNIFLFGTNVYYINQGVAKQWTLSGI